MRFKFVLLAICGLSSLPLSVMAQSQEPGGVRFTLDVDQLFGAGENPGLEVPSQGSYALSNTQLLFGLSSETNTHRIALNFGGSLRLGKSPPDVGTGFKSPLINLEYERDRANSALSFGAGYQENDISFLGVADFTDSDGKLDLPDDYADITGSGTRNLSYFNADWETGRNDPIGFLLSIDSQTTTYDDATSTSLTDYSRSAVEATTLLQLSDVTTGEVTLAYWLYDSDDVDRNNASINLGFDYAISETTSFAASLGYEETRSKYSSGTDLESGLVYDLALIREMPNGTATASLDSSRSYLGERLRARGIRSMELPAGSLSYSAGATSLNGGNVNFIGFLNWEKELPTGDINLSLDRDVSFDNEDDERLLTTALAEYRYEIDDNSGLGFGVLYYLSDYGNSAQNVERAGITTAYRYGLTSDWNLILGLNYRYRDEGSVGRANSGSVFLNLARNFEFLN